MLHTKKNFKFDCYCYWGTKAYLRPSYDVIFHIHNCFEKSSSAPNNRVLAYIKPLRNFSDCLMTGHVVKSHQEAFFWWDGFPSATPWMLVYKLLAYQHDEWFTRASPNSEHICEIVQWITWQHRLSIALYPVYPRLGHSWSVCSLSGPEMLSAFQ